MILPDQDNNEEDKDPDKTKETVPVHDVSPAQTFFCYQFLSQLGLAVLTLEDEQIVWTGKSFQTNKSSDVQTGRTNFSTNKSSDICPSGKTIFP